MERLLVRTERGTWVRIDERGFRIVEAPRPGSRDLHRQIRQRIRERDAGKAVR